MNEPSILDYLKSRLNPWQKEKIEIPQATEAPSLPETVLALQPAEEVSVPHDDFLREPELSSTIDQVDGEREITIKLRIPATAAWRILGAVVLAFFAQRGLEPPVTSFPTVFGLYFFAFVLLAWAYTSGEFNLPAPEQVSRQTDPQTFHRKTFLAGIFLAFLAFLLFSDNLFTTLNVTFWLAALALFVRSLWLGGAAPSTLLKEFFDFFKRDVWHVSITRWAVLLVMLTAAIIFFRFYRLDAIPGEPFSDQAEKLLDVFDITQGQTHIFFPRNTGREFIQFYLTALIAWVFNSGLTFFTLKTGTALIGLLPLPYVYLLGKEVGGKRVALFALALAGTSYWLNTISRIGLRFPLYPAFAAPALYYLICGLRRQNRNYFILSGLFLGLGLHGYSPYRFVPIVIALGVGLYLLHRVSIGQRKQTLLMFSILVLASFLVFLPLMRYAIENPDMFSYRALSRLTGEEQALPAPVWQVFMQNTFNAMTMFNYDDGEIWVHSIPHRPALDVVSALLFLFGYIFLFVRYLRQRSWLDLYLILCVPMLLMPSILSLAFPGENPSLNRTGGAAVVVFVIAALALDGIYVGLQGLSRRRGFALGVVTVLLLIASLQNYTLVFDTFNTQFMRGAWNTSDMGKVIRSFVSAGNSPDNAFVVPFPYWVDTRLVGIQAGYVTKDYALWREDLPKTQSITGNKLFIVKEDDQETLTALKALYPLGQIGHFVNPLEGKNFWIYTVSENQTVNP